MDRIVHKIKQIKKWQCFLACFFILFIGLYTNLASKICYGGVSDFDWWSNDIMISDMMYVENFGNDRLFLYSVTPPKICGDDILKAKGIQPEMFKNGEFFEQDLYGQYTSNIVAQRYIYRFLLERFPVSHTVLLNMLYMLNCILAAIVIAFIFMWMFSYTDSIICLIGVSILSFFCPYFAMYGKNLYWCMWSLFLPMASMGIVVTSITFTRSSKAKKRFMTSIVAFVSCFVKMVICFEFMTSVMIAMTIPIFFYCISGKDKLIDTIKMMIGPFIGAMTAFIVTFMIKISMLFSQYGSKKGIDLILDNFEERLLGTEEDVLFNGRIEVIIKMIKKEFISFKGIGRINFMFAIVILVMMIIGYFYLKKKEIIKMDIVERNDHEALLKINVLSILAPLSWFILAAPHTAIHDRHASITWFIPFGIVFIILVGSTIKQLMKLLPLSSSVD